MTRPCEYRPRPPGSGPGAADEWRPATFHAWGQNHEEYEGGPGPFPVAIVEDRETGQVHAVYVASVRFPPGPRAGDEPRADRSRSAAAAIRNVLEGVRDDEPIVLQKNRIWGDSYTTAGSLRALLADAGLSPAPAEGEAGVRIDLGGRRR